MSKKRIVRTIRNVSISIVVLLIVLVGAGVGYTWFVGRTPVAQVTLDAEEETPVPTVERVPKATNAPQGASVQSLTSPIAPGDNASVIVKTNPGSWCTISVVYDTVASTDSGLKGKTSDEFGVVTWTWTVEASQPTGKWPVTITCLRNKLSAVVIGDLVVAYPTDTIEEN